jgi:hypothetical protein
MADEKQEVALDLPKWTYAVEVGPGFEITTYIVDAEGRLFVTKSDEWRGCE